MQEGRFQPVSCHFDPLTSSSQIVLMHGTVGGGVGEEEEEDDAHATCPIGHDTPLFRFSHPTPQPPTLTTHHQGRDHRLAATSDFPSDQNSREAAARGIPSCVSVTSVGIAQAWSHQKRLGDLATMDATVPEERSRDGRRWS